MVYNNYCTIIHANSCLHYNSFSELSILCAVHKHWNVDDTSTCYYMTHAGLPLTSNSHASSSEVQYRSTSTPATSSTPGIMIVIGSSYIICKEHYKQLLTTTRSMWAQYKRASTLYSHIWETTVWISSSHRSPHRSQSITRSINIM